MTGFLRFWHLAAFRVLISKFYNAYRTNMHEQTIDYLTIYEVRRKLNM